MAAREHNERTEPNEVEVLHVAFRRAAELLAAGNGAWKVTPNALKAMRDAVSKFQRHVASLEKRMPCKGACQTGGGIFASTPGGWECKCCGWFKAATLTENRRAA